MFCYNYQISQETICGYTQCNSMEFSLCVSLFVAQIELKWKHSWPAGDIGGFSIGIGKNMYPPMVIGIEMLKNQLLVLVLVLENFRF